VPAAAKVNADMAREKYEAMQQRVSNAQPKVYSQPKVEPNSALQVTIFDKPKA